MEALLGKVSVGLLVSRLGTLALVIAITVAVNEPEDWQPVELVVALAVLYAIADSVVVWARRVRLTAGMTVQMTAAALLGPGPAVAMSLVSNLIDSTANRLPLGGALTNIAMIPALGLVGGILFEVGGSLFGLDRDMPAYAALVPPIYMAAFVLNVIAFAAFNPSLARRERRRILPESAVPMIPWELLNCVLTATVVLAWALSGLGAVAGLLVALVVSLPLLRSLGAALKTSDDLVALREVSDERAAEVERLSSDRDRLLSELLQAEGRERARLAESLHDGPLQRLVALRQDAADSAPFPPDAITDQLDAAIAEARAIISAFHPAAVRELGFEASLRAAIAPFPAARKVDLTVRGSADEELLADTPLVAVAQELVVNAVKHARPSVIDVDLALSDEGIVLEVSDDGVGIDAGSSRAVQAGHVGLALVRRRVEDAGGAFEIATRADGGTRSRAVLPLPRERDSLQSFASYPTDYVGGHRHVR
jgi:signal transduction histidine kinase